MKIGVLGGIGPEATGIFYLKLIKKLQDEKIVKCNNDFPQIVINSIPAKELVDEKISKKDLDLYLEGLKELENQKVDFIIMICNTIHLFRNQFQKIIKVPIIDLKKEIHDELIKNKNKKIFVLGSPTTIKKLYNFKNITLLKPTKKELNIISKSIFLFNCGKNKNEQIINIRLICEKYFSKNCEVVILGCTELGVMLEKEKIPKIDSLDVLVNATFKRIEESIKKD